MIRNSKEAAAGAMFMALGVIAAVLASNYSAGAASRMGPGYYPRLLGILLVILGLAMVVRSFRGARTILPSFEWKPTLIVLGCVVLFGAIVNTAGLLLSSVVLIIGASAASSEYRPVESLIAGVALAGFSAAVFVWGLDVQLPLLPGGR